MTIFRPNFRGRRNGAKGALKGREQSKVCDVMIRSVMEKGVARGSVENGTSIFFRNAGRKIHSITTKVFEAC